MLMKMCTVQKFSPNTLMCTHLIVVTSTKCNVNGDEPTKNYQQISVE